MQHQRVDNADGEDEDKKGSLHDYASRKENSSKRKHQGTEKEEGSREMPIRLVVLEEKHRGVYEDEISLVQVAFLLVQILPIQTSWLYECKLM